jgi:DNA-binding GntR family transcriptional regulator
MDASWRLVYQYHISVALVGETLSGRAYDAIRRKIVRLDLAPGDVVSEADLQRELGIGRTPIREALQRLAREQFIVVMPRRGMIVSGVDVTELAMLYETRAILEPYAVRLAAERGHGADWDEMEAVLAGDTARAATAAAGRTRTEAAPGASAAELIEVDRRCHEIVWRAAANRFLVDTLDMLYAQSDRLWHMYLADVADMDEAVDEHRAILGALRGGDADGAASLAEAHVRSFDAQIRDAVSRRLSRSARAGSRSAP